MALAEKLLTQDEIEAIALIALWDGLSGGTCTVIDTSPKAFTAGVKKAAETVGITLHNHSDYGNAVIYPINADKYEREIMASGDKHAVLSAVTAAHEGRPFPIVDFLRSNINTAIGTLYYGNSMWEEMRAASLGAKSAEKDAGQYKANDAFYAATEAGAAVMAKQKETGRIDVGAEANITVLSLERFEPLTYPFIQILYGGACEYDVKHVVANGFIRKQDFKPVKALAEEISKAKEKANKAIRTVQEESLRYVL
jgi:imidazolonepropionase-like amidohydrolase